MTRLSDFFLFVHAITWRYWQEEVFSGDTRASTPSWPPLWRIPLPVNTHTQLLNTRHLSFFCLFFYITGFVNWIQSMSLTATEKHFSFREKRSHLNDIQAGSASPTHVDSDGFDQCTLGEILDLLGHGGAEEQSLSLSLNKNIRNDRTYCVSKAKALLLELSFLDFYFLNILVGLDSDTFSWPCEKQLSHRCIRRKFHWNCLTR